MTPSQASLESTRIPPSGPAAGAPRRRRPPGPLLVGIGLLALIAAGLVAVLLIGGSGDEGKLEGTGFSISRQDGWTDLTKQDLAATGNLTVAGLRRDKGTGLLLVRVKGQAPGDFRKFSSDLTRELDRRLPDFQRRSARIVRVRSGSAFFFSYVRRRKGTVHTVTVVPAGKRSFAIDTITPGGDQQAAREAAQMILSFDAAR